LRLFDEETAIPATAAQQPLWMARLKVPNYQIGEAARYARVASGTVRAWHSDTTRAGKTLSQRDAGSSLSYLQLVEVAVVAACRKAGVTLRAVREAREYVSKQLHSEYPFAQYQFKTDGKELLMTYDQVVGEAGKGALLSLNKKGQLAWDEIINPCLREFDYENDLALRWHVAGVGSKIIIDPRISFGAPSVKGVPTWLLKDRWIAGEDINETSGDLGLPVRDIESALAFEKIDLATPQRDPWLN
jgi:uncharacterized protein (DUF433 family)